MPDSVTICSWASTATAQLSLSPLLTPHSSTAASCILWPPMIGVSNTKYPQFTKVVCFNSHSTAVTEPSARATLIHRCILHIQSQCSNVIKQQFSKAAPCTVPMLGLHASCSRKAASCIVWSRCLYCCSQPLQGQGNEHTLV